MKIPIDPLKVVPFVAHLYDWWSRTLRYEVVGPDWNDLVERNLDGEPFVIVLWHGELFPAGGFGHSTASNFVVLISQSKDGEFISQVLNRLGHITVRGSSSRGGLKALLQAARSLKKEKRMAVFTMDGPRGPRHKAKDGAIFLAQRAGAKILPIRAFPKRKKVFNSWDKFVLPMPFTKCRICIGEPMEVTSEKLEKEVMANEKERLERRMSELGLEQE